jgi:hypothetical protein
VEDTRNYNGVISTYLGGMFHPLKPREDEFNIFDIAHSASLTTRWCGHTRWGFNLAHHQVLVSRLAEQRAKEKQRSGQTRFEKSRSVIVVAVWGLLHDGSESYIADLSRPVKSQMPQYYAVETELMRALCDWAGLPYEMPDEVKWADDVLLCSENRDLNRPTGIAWTAKMPTERLPFKIRPWPARYSEYRYLRRFTELTGVPTLGTFVRNTWDDVKAYF